MAESQGPTRPRRKTLAFSWACHFLLSSYLGYTLNFQSLSHALFNARRLYNGVESTENRDYFDKVVGGICARPTGDPHSRPVTFGQHEGSLDMPNAMIFWSRGTYFVFISSFFLLKTLVSGWPSYRNCFQSCFIDRIAGI